jgi:hypothetical protein
MNVMFECIRRIGMCALLLGVVILAREDEVQAGSIREAIEEMTGFDVMMQKKDISMLHRSVDLQDIQLCHPAIDQENVIVEIPRVHATYRLRPLLRGRVHIKTLDIHVKQLAVVQRTDGTWNLDALRRVDPNEELKDLPPLRIDQFRFIIDRVIWQIDHPGRNEQRNYDINLSEDLQMVNDPYGVIRYMIARGLAHVVQLARRDTEPAFLLAMIHMENTWSLWVKQILSIS